MIFTSGWTTEVVKVKLGEKIGIFIAILTSAYKEYLAAVEYFMTAIKHEKVFVHLLLGFFFNFREIKIPKLALKPTPKNIYFVYI